MCRVRVCACARVRVCVSACARMCVYVCVCARACFCTAVCGGTERWDEYTAGCDLRGRARVLWPVERSRGTVDRGRGAVSLHILCGAVGAAMGAAVGAEVGAAVGGTLHKTHGSVVTLTADWVFSHTVSLAGTGRGTGFTSQQLID